MISAFYELIVEAQNVIPVNIDQTFLKKHAEQELETDSAKELLLHNLQQVKCRLMITEDLLVS